MTDAPKFKTGELVRRRSKLDQLFEVKAVGQRTSGFGSGVGWTYMAPNSYWHREADLVSDAEVRALFEPQDDLPDLESGEPYRLDIEACLYGQQSHHFQLNRTDSVEAVWAYLTGELTSEIPRGLPTHVTALLIERATQVNSLEGQLAEAKDEKRILEAKVAEAEQVCRGLRADLEKARDTIPERPRITITVEGFEL